jgi:hypothetical protein
MSFDSRVLELLQEWEERHEAGQPVTPEELCRDCPEQLEAVRQGIADLQAFPDTAAQEANGSSVTAARLAPSVGLCTFILEQANCVEFADRRITTYSENGPES